MQSVGFCTLFISSLALGASIVTDVHTNVKVLPADLKTGRPVQRFLDLTDPDARLGAYKRTYVITVPDTYNGITATPLVIYFHGQYGSFESEGAGFAELGLKKGYITVAPKGMENGHPGATSWSVKAEGRSDVCTAECTPLVFTSCKIVGRVSRCNWATCYDDVFFVKQLLDTLNSELQIDKQRIYATGASNGGMFSDYLATQLPGVFAAVAPWYGAFLQNTLIKPPLNGVSLLSLHGLKDEVIPAMGGESYDHYLYDSQEYTVLEWAMENGCSAEVVRVTPPFESQSMEYTCIEYPGCSSDATVMYCFWPNEYHGFWPMFAEELTWWFFSVYCK